LETNRVPFEDITAGLATKSDKIRALAKAGYARAEIAALLGIRYQHVRKVLLDAGITGGLKNVKLEVEHEPVEVELSDDTEPVSAEILLKAGFKLLGNWTQPAPGEILLSAKAPNDPGVYAFVLEGVIVYVGLTQTGLRTRLDHYRRGHERQRTSRRVKGLISANKPRGSVPVWETNRKISLRGGRGIIKAKVTPGNDYLYSVEGPRYCGFLEKKMRCGLIVTAV
jgi:hypothetical protein